MASAQQVMAELGRIHMENLELRAALARAEDEKRDLEKRLEAATKPATDAPPPSEPA